MNIRFITNLFIDGIQYEAGKTYPMPDWLARSFISSGYAEVPGLSVLGGKEEEPEEPPAKKPTAKKTAAKKPGRPPGKKAKK
jgi:hypothetical protein